MSAELEGLWHCERGCADPYSCLVRKASVRRALAVSGSEAEGSFRSCEVPVDRRRAWRTALNWVRYRAQVSQFQQWSWRRVPQGSERSNDCDTSCVMSYRVV